MLSLSTRSSVPALQHQLFSTSSGEATSSASALKITPSRTALAAPHHQDTLSHYQLLHCQLLRNKLFQNDIFKNLAFRLAPPVAALPRQLFQGIALPGQLSHDALPRRSPTTALQEPLLQCQPPKNLAFQNPTFKTRNLQHQTPRANTSQRQLQHHLHSKLRSFLTIERSRQSRSDRQIRSTSSTQSRYFHWCETSSSRSHPRRRR